MIKKTLFIAEIGENHIGDMDIAKSLIKKAAQAKADYVKFQSYNIQTFRDSDPEYEWFKKVSLSDEAHFMLKKYAERLGIKFLTSPFNLERTQFLSEKLGMKEVKIASGVMLKFSLLDYINEHFDTVFLSTGLATVAEIKKSLSHLNKVKKIYILHCVSQYPCKYEEANLLAIRALKKDFPGYEIGYSDHTAGYLAPLIAVALGASVIEKHFTFDKNAQEGTDHIISVEGDELKGMISSIREVRLLLGTEKKEPTLSERKIIDFVRNRFL